MRKSDKTVKDPDLGAEYDFSKMAGRVRGKYVDRYRAGVNLVLLEPEVAATFPTDKAVNEALRKAMRTAKASRRQQSLPRYLKRRTRPSPTRKR